MKLPILQSIIAVMALLLIQGSAWAVNATTVIPNAGPKAGGQLVTIAGNALTAANVTTVNFTLNAVNYPATIVGFNALGTECYVTTGSIGAVNAGTATVNLNGAAGPFTATSTYLYLKTTQVNMLQVVVSVKMAAATQICWDSTTVTDDLGVLHNNGSDVTNFSWYVRDAELSASKAVANVGSYYVDAAPAVYQIDDPANFNGQRPVVKNASTTGTTEKLYATAQNTTPVATRVWKLGSAAGVDTMVMLVQDSTAAFVPLTSTTVGFASNTVQIHGAFTTLIGTFPLLLQVKTPTSSSTLNAQTITVQITATQ